MTQIDTPAAPLVGWRRWLDWLGRFDTAWHETHDDIQDRRIAALEQRILHMEAQSRTEAL